MAESIRTSGKNGIEVTEYNGEYSLTATYEGKDGKYWQQWGKVRVGKEAYSDKDRPVKAILGDKATAAAALVTALKEITGADYKPDGDTPF